MSEHNEQPQSNPIKRRAAELLNELLTLPLPLAPDSTRRQDERSIVVQVVSVHIPTMSSVAYCEGVDDRGRTVHFICDQRPCREIGEQIAKGEEITSRVQAYQITRIEEVSSC